MRLHLQAREQCAICDHDFVAHDPVVACEFYQSSNPAFHVANHPVYGDQYSFMYKGQTREFPFPEKDASSGFLASDRLVYCRMLDICKTCSNFDTPEYIPVHRDCFEIFFGRYKDTVPNMDVRITLDRLWLLTAWRLPFRGTPELNIKEADATAVDLVAAKAVADRCNGSRGVMYKLLLKLSPELIYIIHGFSMTGAFWRLVRAAALADKACTIKDSPMKFEGLDSVISWARGEPLKIIPPMTQGEPKTHIPEAFWLRVTIGRDGIVKIERLSQMPPYEVPVNLSLRYVVFACNLKEARYEYVMRKDGYIRLFLNESRPLIKSWNTPGPPNSKGSRIISHAITRWTTSHIVVLDRTVRGITFFFCTHHSVWGFHVHRRTSPDAISAYNKLPSRAHKDTYWIHFPISEEDEITGYGSMWIYGNFAAVVRTRLTGDNFTMSGALSNDDFLSVDWMDFDSPTTLVYTDPVLDDQIDMFNLYNPDVEGIPQRLVKSVPPPIQTCVEPKIDYFSTSPLDNVVSATVYYIDDTEFCRGIVFGYANGGERAIGECRVGMDRRQTAMNPTHICFAEAISARSPDVAQLSLSESEQPRSQKFCRTRVIFTADGVAALQKEQWQCYPMKGVVRLWFDHESHYIRVDNE